MHLYSSHVEFFFFSVLLVAEFFLLTYFLKLLLIQVATSLSSTDCFLLQSGSSIFVWHGNFSTSDQQQLAVKIAEFLKVCFFLL